MKPELEPACGRAPGLDRHQTRFQMIGGRESSHARRGGGIGTAIGDSVRTPDHLLVAGGRSSALTDRRFLAAILLAALAAGVAAAIHYYREGLTLSHYDARAHLVVARRILDSLTPGWRQIGAVWLPLPHLVNMLPVQVDVFYRTGAFAVAVSIVSLGAAAYGAAALALQASGSRAAAAAAAGLLTLNPNVLYLQSTPMTEPMLLGLLLLGLARLHRWVVSGGTESTVAAGSLLLLACLTRYEAWVVAGAAMPLAGLALWREGAGTRTALRRTARMAAYPAAAVVLFVGLSRATVGEWLVTGGFFVPDGEAFGRPLVALGQIGWGLMALSGVALVSAAALGAVLIAAAAVRDPRRTSLLLVLAPAAAAALPLYAFVQGHPFRIRYMVPLVAAAAVSAAAGAGLLRRGGALLAALVVALALLQAPPLDREAPMVLEAQWDLPRIAERRELGRHLATHRRAEPILASMGSLAPTMQELSRSGLAIRDFVHEGNGELWMHALISPRDHVGWILFREDESEGRDALKATMAGRPDFFDGFERAAEGGGLALYRRVR